MYAPDGSHPNLRGSYLAACVFFAMFYGDSPVGNPFIATLSAGDAAFLQQCAADAVFTPTCGAIPYSGPGLQGANVLTLLPLGSPDLGNALTLQTTGIDVNAPLAWHLLSTADEAAPFLAGTLLVDAGALVIPPFAAPVTGPGTVDLTIAVPADPSLTGATTFWQTVATDPVQPAGYALSNGLELILCP